MIESCETSDLLIFSPLRWDYVVQRPQEFAARFARHRRVYYVESPIIGSSDKSRLHLIDIHNNIQIIIPHLEKDLDPNLKDETLKSLINEFLNGESLFEFTSLYFSSHAFEYTDHLKPLILIYDPILKDEASRSRQKIIKRADILMKPINDEIPSLENVNEAVSELSEPQDLSSIPFPRIGFYGSVDDRLNLKLIEAMADIREDFQFILIGPNQAPIKIPTKPNIHYLGDKRSEDLSHYLFSLNCTMLPMMTIHDASDEDRGNVRKFLTAGKPVVATPLKKLLHLSQTSNLIQLSAHPEHFIECIERALIESTYDPTWSTRVDQFLESESWESAFQMMARLELEMLTQMRTLSQPECEHRHLISIDQK
jgi:UDP-galactopyranose mutase